MWLGGVTLDLAKSGAAKVIGVDLKPSRIQFCKENLEANYPQLLSIVEYYCSEFSALELVDCVDIIV